MSTAAGAVRVLREARATIAQRIATLAALAERNLALRLRLSSLSLLERVLAEISDHRRAHGAAPGPLETLLSLLLRSGMGGNGDGDGDGSEPQQQPLSSAPSQPQSGPGSSAYESGSCPNDSGSYSIGAGQSISAGQGSDGNTDAADDSGGVFAQLPHLAPGRRVLLLHEASEAEVAKVRVADAAAIKRDLRDHHDAAVRLMREVEAAHAASDAAALECAQAELKEQSVRFSRYLSLVICWVFEANSEAATTHFETNELLLGLSDARLPHWQQVVSATQFTHPQALLFTDIQACVQARLQAVRAQRAELSSALAGAAAGPTAPGAAAAAGDTGPGAATAAAAAAASREADLLAALEANVAGEAALIQASSFAIIAALTPGQFMSGFCASWPYPLSTPAVCDVLATKLRLEGADAFHKELPAD